jgi:hypothetical protein
MTHLNRNWNRLAALLIALGASACASTTPQLDAQFGQSMQRMLAQQTLDPRAIGNPDPVRGIDGKAAKTAYDEYQKSFREKVAPPAIINVGVGGR